MHVEAARQDVGGGVLHERDELELQLRDVEQRLVVEDHVVVAEAAFDGHEYSAHEIGQVRAHHALRPAGSAGGVHNEGRVVPADVCLGLPFRPGRDEVLEWDFAARRTCAHIHELLDPDPVLDRLDRHAQRLFEHENPGARIVHDILHLVRGQAVVDRHRDRADLHQSVEGGDLLGQVVGEDRHPVAFADAGGAEGVRRLVD